MLENLSENVAVDFSLMLVRTLQKGEASEQWKSTD
jgi:hypothetical protein